MGKALELISGRTTAPGATITAVTMNTGNSNQVRNAALNSDIRLLNMWQRNNAAGISRWRSPKFHDNVQGIRNRVVANDVSPLLVPGTNQKLVAQDQITIELSGSAVGGEIETTHGLIYYADLPGAEGRFIDPAELMRRQVNYLTNEVSITAGATGDYTGQVAINANFDLLKANTDYALVGYTVNVLCSAVRVLGPDFGNLGVGGPGLIGQRWLTERWFYHHSQQLAMPLIPVFNSANKGGTLVDVVQNQAAAAVVVTLSLFELAAPGASTSK
jgi:hypothetical protein